MVDRQLMKHQVFMSVAFSLARLGTCSRGSVGAVIVRDGRCISWGYNGAPPGLPHCEEVNHGHPAQVDTTLPQNGCRIATHAEANALSFAAKQGISTDGATVYMTVAPCSWCSRLLIAAGIKRVIYYDNYRDMRGIQWLKDAGVHVVNYVEVGDG